MRRNGPDVFKRFEDLFLGWLCSRSDSLRVFDDKGGWVFRGFWLSVNWLWRHVERGGGRVGLWSWIKNDFSVLGRRYRYFGIRTSELMVDNYLFILTH